ncbi:RNA polymerase sigma-70 factor (ECF subfamily) [Anseongella ginsenosidimutans]|uniref:RNA polymerase sigma-70 factor (ECF subfamily) n=1 Tax=Anseongella ginsenosidimutans TaxID=496056 RepID=A0A4R3KSW8_9SPHI|nr:sigma-70 family RNA polymerase sigma factor [Anseongella ginsenosidimutans]QEC53428.1 sigma-70 family RNA polymerase sigma factor [Anseongella ginsenosidimutans]TCS88318.1 RNA polymerase sigma-70 factor (ECF subfamily) [Anseongella ginsenosidimutans]
MKQQELIPHLFRTEFRKIAATLCSHFGMVNMDLAEDIASETFIAALETWPRKGIPENPAAWLYTVAKNKARNQFSRSRLFTDKIAGELKGGSSSEEMEIDFSEEKIRDSQLRMLFAICHPAIGRESQVALALRILCGFGIEEIATAFLSNKETINKRLFRAKEKLKQEKAPVEFPREAEISVRLDAVLTTIYLLYSEGYYSESNNMTLRRDLCLEAMRLAALLLDTPLTARPEVSALLALMCFHSSRFAARQNDNGEMILFRDQDESLWNRELISRGAELLRKAARGNQISPYHLEAAIAFHYTNKTDTVEKWKEVLNLYNLLLLVRYSPVAALNRTYAFSKVHGRVAAIREAEKLPLTNNHYYYTLLGALYTGIDDSKARSHYLRALSLAKTKGDKQSIQKKLKA